MTERGMRGYSVIVNRLIDNVFWLSCKDERKKRNDRLSEGDSIFPYIKKHAELFKKDGDVFKKHHHLFGKHQGLFAAWECAKTKPTYPIVSCRGRVHLPENSLLCVFGQVNPAPTNETTALSTF